MALVVWTVAAAVAGLLGALGPTVIARLPASPDAEPDVPGYDEIARAPRLSWWLAMVAVVLVSIVAVAVPAALLPAWTVLCGVGIWLAYIDARTKLLPTRIVWPLFAVLLAVVAAEAWLADDLTLLIRAVIASLVAFGVFWVFWWFGGFFRGGGFGYGDVRLAAPLGLVLGTGSDWAAPIGLYLGIVIAGVVGLTLKARGKDNEFGLGPWLLVGAVLGPLAVAVS